MTEKRKERAKTYAASEHSASFSLALCLLLLILFLAQSERLNEWMQNSLSLCANVLIPSLFPFLILSDLILSAGAADRLGAVVAKPFRALLGISGAGVSAVLLGMLCGFPIGARMTVSLYEQGRIDRGEAERLLAFCSIPSPAFLIGSVGVSLLGSRSQGILLYAVNVTSSFLVCLFSYLLSPKKKREPSVLAESPPKASLSIAQFTRAIANSANGMLHICAFVLAFSCIIRLLGLLLSYLPLSLPPFFSTLLFGFFELTGGMTYAAQLPQGLSLLACAIISGWSGLSVHAQIVSLSDTRPLSFRPYLLSKTLSAALNALIVGCILLWERATL